MQAFNAQLVLWIWLFITFSFAEFASPPTESWVDDLDDTIPKSAEQVSLLQYEKAYQVKSTSNELVMLNSDAGSHATPAEVQRYAGLVTLAVGIFLTGVLAVFIRQAPSRADVLVILCTCATALVTSIGVWGDVQGGGVDIHSWYGYHPVFMVCSFMGAMVLARWAYLTESPLGSKQTRRRIHAVIMVFALMLAIAGYLSIFKHHQLEKKRAATTPSREWEPWRRSLHIYTGYAAIGLALLQAIMGIWKYALLQLGEKLFELHGTLGKVIIFLGGANILLATSFQTWGSGVSLLMGLLVGTCTFVGTVMPSGTTVQTK